MSIWQATYCCQTNTCPSYRHIHQITIAEGQVPNMSTAVEEKERLLNVCFQCGKNTKKYVVFYDLLCYGIPNKPPHVPSSSLDSSTTM